jgi:DNA-binding LacI/PurR family transcriptional regulator
VAPPLRKKETDSRINIYAPEMRAQGFSRFFGKKHDTQFGLLTGKDFCEQAAAMIRSGGEKAAFLCYSGVHAIDLYNYFFEHHIRVPKDAGIMGFDNLDILASIRPRLTTTSTSIETVGREAIAALFRLIQGEEVPEINYAPHRIIPGETL